MTLTSKVRHEVPSVDSADNVYIRDVVGNKNDTHDGDSIKSFSRRADEHIHTSALVYPTGAAGVTITASDAGAWTLGSFTEIVPADTITNDFDIHFVNIEAVSEDTSYELVLYGATTEIGRIRFTSVTIANAGFFVSVPMQTTICEANSQIQAKLMSATGVADTLTVSLFYHQY